MAPEQVRGLPVDARADVWAFGCVLYEMVTGQSPFIGKTTADILAAVLERNRSRRRHCARMCRWAWRRSSRARSRRNRHERFQTMADVADALRAVARSLETLGPRQAGDARSRDRPTSTRRATTPCRHAAEPATSRRFVGRSRRAMLMGLATVALAVALAAWVLEGHRCVAPPAAPVAAPPAHTLRAWLTVQKMRDGKPYQSEFISSGQEIFENGWKFRLNASSPDRTYLYVVNEGPGPGGITTLHLFFPAPQINQGSPQLTLGAPMQSGWYFFTEHQGIERFWLVAAREPVPELEAVKGGESHGSWSRRRSRPVAAIQALLARASPPSYRRERRVRQAHCSEKSRSGARPSHGARAPLRGKMYRTKTDVPVCPTGAVRALSAAMPRSSPPCRRQPPTINRGRLSPRNSSRHARPVPASLPQGRATNRRPAPRLSQAARPALA